MRTIKTDQLFNVPGEHDVYTDLGKQYMAWFGSRLSRDRLLQLQLPRRPRARARERPTLRERTQRVW